MKAMVGIAAAALSFPAAAGAQGTDYSRIANYCPSQAYRAERPAFDRNVRGIRYPVGSPEWRARRDDYRAAFQDRVRGAIERCEAALARNPRQPWWPGTR